MKQPALLNAFRRGRVVWNLRQKYNGSVQMCGTVYQSSSNSQSNGFPFKSKTWHVEQLPILYPPE